MPAIVHPSAIVDEGAQLGEGTRVWHWVHVSAGGDLPSDEAILTIPPAGMDTVTLDAQTQATLGSRGWVNFMSMITK